MKQKSTFLKVFMTLMLLLGVSSVWGENLELTFDLTKNNLNLPTAKGKSEAGTYKYTLNNVEYSFIITDAQGTTDGGIYFGSSYVMVYSGNAIGTPAIDGYKLTKVVAKNSSGCSTSVNVGISSSASSASYIAGGAVQKWATTSSSYTYELTETDANKVYYLYVTSKNAQITELTLTYSPVASNTPSISANNVDLAANATSGEISYTISNPVEGKSLTAETSTEWISNVTVDATNSKVTFNTTANTGAQREGTITLKYEGATNKNVTITQAKPTTFASIEALVAAGAPASDGTETVTVTLTNEVIKSFYTSSGYRNGIFLNYTNTEGKDIEIYCKNVPDAWIAGGTLSGTLTDCAWKVYSGIWELCPTSWDELTYTAPATYAINIDDAIANGTVEASATEAAAGVEVSLTVTPADHYELVSLSVKDKADNDIPVTDNKFTMPTSEVTVSATFAEKTKFTVSYNALGEAAGSEDVYDGELIAAAPTPTLAGWELIGWTTNNAYETSTTAPTAFDLSTPITEDLNLYAVFQKTVGEGGKYVLDYDADVKEKTLGYGSAVNVTAADGSEWVVKAYKSSGMQINTGKNASIKIPNCSANITSIEIACTAAKAVGLSAEDYTGSGTISYITTGSDATSQTLDCSGVSVTGGYIVAKSGSTAITKIVVNYGNATTYYTTSGILTQDVAISAVGYSTYSSAFDLVVPADETVYGAKIKNENSVELIPVDEGTIIKAGEGFIVKGDANGTVTFTVSFAAGSEISGNELLGTGNETLDLTAGDAYLLGASAGKAIFALCNAGTLGANKACLPAPSGANSVLGFDDATGIIAVSNNVINNGAMYNLNGQAVSNDYKGIVIVNGKKFLNK